MNIGDRDIVGIEKYEYIQAAKRRISVDEYRQEKWASIPKSDDGLGSAWVFFAAIVLFWALMLPPMIGVASALLAVGLYWAAPFLWAQSPVRR